MLARISQAAPFPLAPLSRQAAMFLLVALCVALVASPAQAQNAPGGSDPSRVTTWRSPDGRSAASAAAEPVETASAGDGARVSSGNGTLPNRHGQIWREYDISPYTLRVTSTERPEQALVDWILRETGYEVWHSDTVSVLSATRRTLTVYHTPEMQAVVGDLVDRFVGSQAETTTFSLRMATVDHPNWRARVHGLLRPVPVQTPGVSAWLLHKEDAAVLLAELRRRSDYREHSSPHLLVNNGQSTVISAMRGRPFVQDVARRGDQWPGFEAITSQIDEGFALEFSPLLSANRQMIDATIKCSIDQVEKMIPVTMELPSAGASRQRTQIEVPQTSQFRFHERFRWPVDEVLLIGLGMVALPVPVDSQPVVPGLPLGTTVPRADLLVFVEAKGKSGNAARVVRAPQDQSRSYQGRY